ncbi:hypothetical protein NPIL_646491 [Nephila pilipes]|uniref:Uncharacterized protein n=1 Tax=Nephila pilipes TaxID=299642 RepID=A0A8X6QUX2_NEPPI|nr:hypothetical protein NPIL_646491 [Nephila pilipes]
MILWTFSFTHEYILSTTGNVIPSLRSWIAAGEKTQLNLDLHLRSLQSPTKLPSTPFPGTLRSAPPRLQKQLNSIPRCAAVSAWQQPQSNQLRHLSAAVSPPGCLQKQSKLDLRPAHCPACAAACPPPAQLCSAPGQGFLAALPNSSCAQCSLRSLLPQNRLFLPTSMINLESDSQNGSDICYETIEYILLTKLRDTKYPYVMLEIKVNNTSLNIF